MARGDQYDVAGPRRHAARYRRLRDLPAAARARGCGADHHAHRARRDRGPRPWTGSGRRRLPDQAVLARRAARPAARAGAARPVERPRCSRSATCGSTPGPARCWRGDVEISSRRASSRCSRRSCAAPARCSASCSCSTPRGTWASSSARTSSRCTSGTCATRSTGRSGSSRSRPPAGSAIGCAGRRRVKRLPIRARMTMAFALAVASCSRRRAFVYVRMRADPDDSINRELHARRRRRSRRWRAGAGSGAAPG